jgi:two-component system response regulator HydG
MNPEEKASVLVVDDDPGHRTTLHTLLRGWGYLTEVVEDGTTAIERVKEEPFDLILMDVRMAGVSGIEALTQIKDYNPAIPILIMTAYSSVESAVEALKSGAYDYLTKPLDFDVLRITMERALEHTNLKKENFALKGKLLSGLNSTHIIGKSQLMKELMEMVAMVAPSEATVLIVGESGTGKELIARAIHLNSSHKEGPLVVVNCAAVAESLLESELFGHERGAFTGAERRREGRFMQANKGTIFLDEIGEMSPVMQAKLLRVIQEREIQRVGGDETLKIDVRILAATHRDLKKAVAAGKFREDLYYRLKVVTVRIPPLRRRVDDVPLLAQHFLNQYAEKNRKPVKGFTPRAMDLLLKYAWPGNVRELENAVERAVILLRGEYISEKELPLSITQSLAEEDSPEMTSVVVAQSLEEVEKEKILNTLAEVDGNKSEAARRLGITRKTLYKKLQLYGK